MKKPTQHKSRVNAWLWIWKIGSEGVKKSVLKGKCGVEEDMASTAQNLAMPSSMSWYRYKKWYALMGDHDIFLQKVIWDWEPKALYKPTS